MKMYASVYWKNTISLARLVVSVGIPGNLAAADDTFTNSSKATVPTSQTVQVATADARAPALPYGVSEVVKMNQGGIGKALIVSYIENTVLPLHLTADGEIYLQHLGVPQDLMFALIHRDGELQRQSAAAYQQQQQATATAAANNQAAASNPAPAVVMPGPPPPVVPYAYPDASAPVVYPDYVAYPYYGYPYFYGPDVFIGGGFGFGRGGGFGRGFGRGGRGGFGGGHGGGHR